MKCEFCKKDILNVKSCTKTHIELNSGKVVEAIPWDPDEDIECPDCNVLPGGYHHADCDHEICPQCGGQLFSCEC